MVDVRRTLGISRRGAIVGGLVLGLATVGSTAIGPTGTVPSSAPSRAARNLLSPLTPTSMATRS